MSKNFDNNGHFSSKKFKQQKESTKACRSFRKNWKAHVPEENKEESSFVEIGSEFEYQDRPEGPFNSLKIKQNIGDS